MTVRSLRTGRLALAVVIASLVAACTSEQDSTPAPTLTSTTSTTSTTLAPVETTEVPVDTSAPTTEAETTTSTTLPAGPADALVPLVIGGENTTGWLYLGAWQNTTWAEATDEDGAPVRPSIAPSTPMTVLSLTAPTTATTGAEAEACFDEQVGPTLDATVPAPEPPGFGYAAVAAVTHDWPFVPRPVAVTATGPDTYRQLGEAIFAGQPVDAAAGTVQQVVVADLDGDGDDEAVVSYEFIQPSAGPGAPGDFAALYLVDTETRASSTILEEAVPADLAADAFPLTQRFRVIAVADVNGDGRMEVAVHAWYYEGASVLLYTYDGTGLTRVLVAGCGS